MIKEIFSSRRILPFVALLAAAAFVAGCGSSDDEALTKAEFVKQGNQICKDGLEDRAESLSSRPGLGTKLSEEEIIAKTEPLVEDGLLPVIQREAEELGDLAAPEGEEVRVDAIVESLEEAVAEGEKDIQGVMSGAPNHFEESNKLAEDYGLTECTH